MKYEPIHMRSVEGKPDHMALDSTLLRHGDGPDIPLDFEWDGSSVPRFLRGLFPKWRHPKASCGHDFDCRNARNKAERAIADRRFKFRVSVTSTREAWVGYIGVRIGAFFGIGSNF